MCFEVKLCSSLKLYCFLACIVIGVSTNKTMEHFRWYVTVKFASTSNV